MRRPAVVRFGVLAMVACVSCWSGKQTTSSAPLENHAPAAAEHDLTAAYWCTITSDGYTYSPMPCVIRKIGSVYKLAKLAGSQRFRGIVKPLRGGGLSFDGEFYCPWGDCSRPLHGELTPTGDGSGNLRGTFDDPSLVVQMTPVPAGDPGFGGIGYGGDGYGGFGDGAGFGGASYGGSRLPRP